MVILILQHNGEFGEVGLSPASLCLPVIREQAKHIESVPFLAEVIAGRQLPIGSRPLLTLLFSKTNSIALQATHNPSSCRSHLSASAERVANPGSVKRRLRASAALWEE